MASFSTDVGTSSLSPGVDLPLPLLNLPRDPSPRRRSSVDVLPQSTPPPSHPSPAQNPLPRQNSSDDLDGYRSSCEGSMPEENHHHHDGGSSSSSSHERHSREDSTCTCAANGDDRARGATVLSAKSLAALGQQADPTEPQRSSPTTAHHHSDHHHHDNNCHPAAAPSHPHRHVRSRPRSSASTAAREEERQRLYAMPPTVESPAGAGITTTTTAAAAAAAAAATSSASAPAALESTTANASFTPSTRGDGKAGRTAGSITTPESLAEASAADSDCSCTDALCHTTNPLFASTNMKTSAAMLHVALDSEKRSAATTPNTTFTAATYHNNNNNNSNSNSKNASASVAEDGARAVAREAVPAHADPPQRVIPPHMTSRHVSPARARTLSTTEERAPLQRSTLSRLSRSSSGDSSAVEATMDAAAQPSVTPPPPTTAAASQRSTSLRPTEHDSVTNSPGESAMARFGGLLHSNGATVCTPVTSMPPPAPSTDSLVSPIGPSAYHTSTDTAAAAAAATVHDDTVVPTSLTAAPLVPPSPSTTNTSATAAAATMTTTTMTMASVDVTHVGEVSAAGVRAAPSPLQLHTRAPRSPPPPSSSALRTPTFDVSSSSSVGGHHLSVTEGNAFLKQSGSRREEAFYNMIRPYQETLVREAVRQAPNTVEHWRHQNIASSSASASAAATRRSGGGGGGDNDASESGAAVPPTQNEPSPLTTAVRTPTASMVIRHVHADVNGMDGSPSAAATKSANAKDDLLSVCEARWEAYQQYEAEDMSSLDILASAPLTTEEEQQHFSPLHRMRSESITATSPVFGGGTPEYAAAAAPPPPTSPLVQQVDKELVELAARLWWTIRFRHFNRTSSAGYEVQRQAAEAAGTSPPSPSTSSLANGGGRDGVVVTSRCSTPVSQHRYAVAPPTGLHGREDGSGTPPLPPAAAPTTTTTANASMSMSVTAAAAAAALSSAATAPQVASLSGTATPIMMGSFAAPSTSEGILSNGSQTGKHYSAQKHRALQLLAAFVPRYHGTLRLFLKDVLRCERRGVAATVAAAAAERKATTAAEAGATAATTTADRHNPLTDGGAGEVNAQQQQQQQHALTTTPKIVDADDDDDDDATSEAGGRKICRMIMLEYVCYRFRLPCVMDIKMGSRQYGLHPTAEKKRSKELKSKLSTSGRYGIRLAGYRRWNAAESRFDFRSKLQCRALTLNEVKKEISAFLMHNRELERVFRRQLQRLRVAFSQQTVFRFYTSSLLFVYDAEDPLATARVTMVDFAYTYESKELLQGGDPDADFAYDIGYLKAIDTLLSLLA